MSPRRVRAALQGFGPEWLWTQLAALSADAPAGPICVALSGGSDSVALLACARAMAAAHRLALRAIHVDHGLQPAAPRFVEFCRALCAQLAIPLTVLSAEVAVARGDSLEARARAARYAAFAAELAPGEYLLLAQHADDQLETVLLQLLRGAGVAGLAAMAERARCGRGTLLRPLLSVRRAALEDYRKTERLDAIDDPMNADLHFDRNFLRQQILPRMLERWPGAVTAVGRSARHAAEGQLLLAELATRDLSMLTDGAALSVPGVRALSAPRRRNALRGQIARLGLPMPDTARLMEISGPLLDARLDAKPVVEWPGGRALRELDRLLLLPAPLAPSSPQHEETVRWDWAAHQALAADALEGVLRLVPDAHGPVDLACLPATLHVRRRKGGERLRPSRGGPRRTVKALLNEARLPQAERAALPLVYAGDQLVAVADRWLDASVQASTQTVRRGRLSWTLRLPSERPLC